MATLPTPPTPSADAEKPQPLPEATAGAAKQYIRTFHGDFDTLKRGGTPDLMPLGALPVPVAKPVTPKAPVPVPAPVPAQVQPVVPVPIPETVPLRAIVPPQAPLKTYAGDFTERMKKTHSSTATVLAAEQDKEPTSVQTPQKKLSLSSILYTVVGSILVIAGGFGAYVAYTKYLAGAVPVMLSPVVFAPIFVDDREEVPGTGTALLQRIQQSATRPLAQGSIRLLYLGATATSTSVFSALQLPAPGALLRNINNAQSMAGIAEVGGIENPFFILSVSSFGDTFAAMLQWEQRMPRDLIKLFPPYPAASVATTTATTTAPIGLSTVSVGVAGFFDVTIANHDVRVYRDAASRDILLYGYWNRTTLIIARDAAAFTEIIGRLATSRAQ